MSNSIHNIAENRIQICVYVLVHAVLLRVQRCTGPSLSRGDQVCQQGQCVLLNRGFPHADLIASEFRANLSETVLLELWQCDFSPMSAALFLAKLLALQPLAANTAF